MNATRVVPVEATYPMTRDQLVALVAGPYMYHHKMDDAAMREAAAFDRCRELTIERIDVLIATRNAMFSAAPHTADAQFSEDTAALVLLSKMRMACGDNGLRMQDELEVYLKGLARDGARWRKFSEWLDRGQVAIMSKVSGADEYIECAREVLNDLDRDIAAQAQPQAVPGE